jgi:hypothetical protein
LEVLFLKLKKLKELKKLFLGKLKKLKKFLKCQASQAPSERSYDECFKKSFFGKLRVKRRKRRAKDECLGVGVGVIWSYLEFLKFSGVMQTTILDGNVFRSALATLLRA